MTVRTVHVCADDFAADEAVSDAILRLTAMNRLSAVSCFTDSPLWPRVGAALVDLDSRAHLGVHFNLIEPFGHGELPLARWIARSLTGRIDAAAVRAHLERQVERFVSVTGRLPDFIDGHQHVHAFAGIRAVVHELAAALRRVRPVLVRAVTPPFGRTDAPFKRRVIQRLAGAGAWPAGAGPLRLNTSFGGDYSLRAAAPFADLVADWIGAVPDGGLIMCHPGSGAAGAARQEYDYFRSARWPELLAGQGVELRRCDRFPSAVASNGQNLGFG